MKKILLACMFAFTTGAFAQVGPPQASVPNSLNGYAFSQSTGVYSPLSASKTVWQTGALLATDAVSTAIPLPSPFIYNGKSYSSINISNNGYVTFGAAASASTYSVLSTDYSPTTMDGAFAGFAVNLKNANTTTSEIAYESVGTKFIVQFTDLMGNTASATQILNFQIQLDFSTKIISIVYGNCVSGTATLSGQVGIRGSESSDVNNRTGTNWATTAVGTSNSSTITLGSTNGNTVPTSGLTFSFSPGTWLSAAASYATMPFNENFSTWANGNSTLDLPNATNWRTWPARGDNSWRQSDIATADTGFATASGWTGNSGSSTVAAPALGTTARFHSYNCLYAEGYMDLYVNLSSGTGTRYVSFDYINVSGADVLKVQFSTDGGTTFTDVGTPLGVSASWANKSFDLGSSSATAIIRFLAKGDNGSDDIYIDNVNIAAYTTPNCTTVTAPLNAATGVTLTPTINWNSAISATSYILNLGTTSGSSNVINGVDVGNVLTYTIPAATSLLYGTTYYAKVIPKNSLGNASGCTEFNFTTKNIGCPSVTLPAANAVAQPLTPTITWSSVTDATGYRISMGTTSGGIDVMNNVDVGNVLTYNVATPLSNSTKYYYTVNAYTATSNSASCTVRSFSTICTATNAPYSENFDTTATGGSSNTNAPTCWEYVETASSAAYGYVSSTNPNSAPNSYYLYNSSATTGNSMLVSPETTNLSDGNKRVRFFARSTTAGYNLEVGSVTDKSTPATYTLIGSAIPLTTTWTQYTVVIPAGTDKFLAFRHGLGGTNRAIYIDDVIVENVPTCGDVTNVTSSNPTLSTIDVAWNVPATASTNGYDIYYSTINTPPTATTPPQVVSTTNNPYTLSGLASSTVYYIWVRSHCTGANTGIWSIASTGATLCSTATVPYVLDFENITIPALPICTTAINAGSGNNWNTYSPADFGFTSKVLNYTYNSSNAADAWFFTQGISLTAGVQYNISYKYGNNGGSTYPEKLKVAYGTDATVAAMVTTIADHPNITNNTSPALINSVTITPTTTGVYYLGFNAYSIANRNRLFLDDISITNANLGTSEASQVKNNIKVYPNPFADVLTISDIKNVKSVSIIDIAGRLVKTIDKPSSQLQLSELKSGMYIVVLNMNDGSKQTIKAIKK